MCLHQAGGIPEQPQRPCWHKIIKISAWCIGGRWVGGSAESRPQGQCLSKGNSQSSLPLQAGGVSFQRVEARGHVDSRESTSGKVLCLFTQSTRAVSELPAGCRTQEAQQDQPARPPVPQKNKDHQRHDHKIKDACLVFETGFFYIALAFIMLTA